jgi:ribosomal protein L23
MIDVDAQPQLEWDHALPAPAAQQHAVDVENDADLQEDTATARATAALMDERADDLLSELLSMEIQEATATAAGAAAEAAAAAEATEAATAEAELAETEAEAATAPAEAAAAAEAMQATVPTMAAKRAIVAAVEALYTLGIGVKKLKVNIVNILPLPFALLQQAHGCSPFQGFLLHS